MCPLMFGCLTLLCAPILAFHCPEVIVQEKHQAYNEQIREVERVCFSPLVCAATEVIGPTASTCIGN